MNAFALSSWTLLQREVVRFLRQRHRIVGALGTPLVFWILIGSGLGKSFRAPLMPGGGGMDYLQYFFPGTVALILLFTAIFSTISVIEDRREGFLQAVLVSPAPRSAIAMGKILGGTALATGQGALFLLLSPLIGIRMGFLTVLYVLSIMLFLSFALTALSFLIAWKMDSTQGFHAIMNLFLMPLWFLSGALFPAAGAPMWMRAVMAANPVTYGVQGLHYGFFHRLLPHAPSPSACLAITVAFGLVLFAASVGLTAKTDGR